MPDATDTPTGFYEDDEPVEDVRRAFDEGTKLTTLPPSGVPAAYHVCRTSPCDHRPNPDAAFEADLRAWAAADLPATDLAELERFLEIYEAEREVIDLVKAWRATYPGAAVSGLIVDAGPLNALGAAADRLTKLERTDR